VNREIANATPPTTQHNTSPLPHSKVCCRTSSNRMVPTTHPTSTPVKTENFFESERKLAGRLSTCPCSGVEPWLGHPSDPLVPDVFDSRPEPTLVSSAGICRKL